MTSLGPASEFPPTDLRADDAILLELRLTAQHQRGVDVELQLQNRSQHRLLIPELPLNSLKLGHVETVQIVDWWSDSLISSTGGEPVLEPGERKSWSWMVRTHRWVEEHGLETREAILGNVARQDDEFRQWDDQGRLAVDLRTGEYLAWYELVVDEHFFNPHTHARLNDLRRQAFEEQALVWIGAAKSNRIQFHHGAVAGPTRAMP
ncbi:MAG TPA: hypothetical protein VM510_07815 [Caulifigura sp.]|nr:hypothetical protein [Caulifigura sp.]